VEGNGCDLFRDEIAASSWRVRGYSWKSSVRIMCVLTEIGTKHRCKMKTQLN
jgi:hypothetical protein